MKTLFTAFIIIISLAFSANAQKVKTETIPVLDSENSELVLPAIIRTLSAQEIYQYKYDQRLHSKTLTSAALSLWLRNGKPAGKDEQADLIFTLQTQEMQNPNSKFVYVKDKGYVIRLTYNYDFVLIITNKQNDTLKKIIINHPNHSFTRYITPEYSTTLGRTDLTRTSYYSDEKSIVKGYSSPESADLYFTPELREATINRIREEDWLNAVRLSQYYLTMLYSENKVNSKFALIGIKEKQQADFPKQTADINEFRKSLAAWSKDMSNKEHLNKIEAFALQFRTEADQCTDKTLKGLLLNNAGLAYTVCGQELQAILALGDGYDLISGFTKAKYFAIDFLQKQLLRKDLNTSETVEPAKSYELYDLYKALKKNIPN